MIHHDISDHRVHLDLFVGSWRHIWSEIGIYVYCALNANQVLKQPQLIYFSLPEVESVLLSNNACNTQISILAKWGEYFTAV